MRISTNKTGAINTQLSLSQIFTANPARVKKLHIKPDLGIKRVETIADGRNISFRAWYTKTWQGSFQGYEGFLRIQNRGGSFKVTDNKISFSQADEILIIGRIIPSKQMANSGIDNMKKALYSFPMDYDQLLSRHKPVHKKLFDQVSIDLKASASDREKSSEALLKLGGDNPALIEKLFDAARYNILSSTGMMPPKLQGIWGGTMTPPWSSDYTTNGNLPVAVSHYLPSNTPELMLPLFDMLGSMMDDFRANARILYNCRGIHIPSHIATRGYDNEFDATWPMTFWTAGAPWYAMFYYDYYLYTLDTAFLKERALPFMEEAAKFYEDFLIEGPNGKYIFSPSYSPENTPLNGNSQACINATMDVMAAKALFRAIIGASKVLKVNSDKVKKWRSMLTKMPDYALNSQGELREWLWHDLKDNHHHRHASHLIGLFGLHDSALMNHPQLREGADRVIDKRMEFRRKQHGGVMAFGMIQLGFAAAALGQTEQAFEILRTLGNLYWNNNLVSTHNPKEIFNVDISGGYPALVMKMLAYSEKGKISILPCLPAAWTSGSIKGMALRGGVIMKELSWRPDKIRVVFTSKVKQQVQILIKEKVYSRVTLEAGKRNIFYFPTEF